MSSRIPSKADAVRARDMVDDAIRLGKITEKEATHYSALALQSPDGVEQILKELPAGFARQLNGRELAEAVEAGDRSVVVVDHSPHTVDPHSMMLMQRAEAALALEGKTLTNCTYEDLVRCASPNPEADDAEESARATADAEERLRKQLDARAHEILRRRSQGIAPTPEEYAAALAQARKEHATAVKNAGLK